MIKNKKQANISIKKLNELKVDLDDFKASTSDKTSPLFSLGVNSIQSLIDEIQSELDEYNSLVSGNFHCLHPKSLKDIPKSLIAARLAQNISQRSLANLLGIKEQQIQRYEAEDYESASICRLVEVANALNVSFYFEKVIIINTDTTSDYHFKTPDGITEKQINDVKNKITKTKSLMIE